ncbi:serine hydrolase [Candidatus Saccharibacteria bacterium]|nr:serine hydrolase [Candidatus Saccharibacteria bacterium]
MVYKTASKRKALVALTAIGIFFISFSIALAILYVTKGTGADVPADDGSVAPSEDQGDVPDEPEVIINKVDFEPLVQEWGDSIPGATGVIIYDLDLDEVDGEYNADSKFATASLYKLFVVYEGYRNIINGDWDGNANAGSTGYSISKCLDLAIRESHSPCAETLWAMIGRMQLDAVVQNDFGLPNVTVGSLSATPREIMEMMKIYYYHSDIIDESIVATMKDSFLNQPVTTYNWRQGLPSGFSSDVLVYNKVGWNWNGSIWTIYDDAAIVEFPELNRHFIVVVMTSGVPFQQITNLGTRIENLVKGQS